MKCNKLFVMMILTALSCQLHAYGSNVTLISSTIERSPGVVGGFTDLPSTSTQSMAPHNKAEAYAQAMAAFGRHNTNINLTSNHGYIVVNRTTHPQSYRLEYKLSLSDGRFIRKIDHIVVRENSSDRGGAIAHMTQLFTRPGTYELYAESGIHGEMSDHKRNMNYVNVSN
jgi:hypothetical protein